MKSKYPNDCSARVVCTKSRSIFVYKINAETWEWHEQTGTDHGTDIILELSDKNNFVGKKIEGQIKGRTKLKYLKNGKIKFDLEVKAANYAVGNPNAFVLFLVDVSKEKVYYLPLQDYFMENPKKFEAVKNNKTVVTVHIDKESNIDTSAEELISLTRYVYITDASGSLKKIFSH